MPEIVLVPRGHGRYTALLDGRPVVTSRQPFFDAARRLLELGWRPDEVLRARHLGSRIVAMQALVGEAAAWSVRENARGLRRVRWVPFPAGKVPSARRGGARRRG